MCPPSDILPKPLTLTHTHTRTARVPAKRFAQLCEYVFPKLNECFPDSAIKAQIVRQWGAATTPGRNKEIQLQTCVALAIGNKTYRKHDPDNFRFGVEQKLFDIKQCKFGEAYYTKQMPCTFVTTPDGETPSSEIAPTIRLIPYRRTYLMYMIAASHGWEAYTQSYDDWTSFKAVQVGHGPYDLRAFYGTCHVQDAPFKPASVMGLDCYHDNQCLAPDKSIQISLDAAMDMTNRHPRSSLFQPEYDQYKKKTTPGPSLPTNFMNDFPRNLDGMSGKMMGALGQPHNVDPETVANKSELNANWAAVKNGLVQTGVVKTWENESDSSIETYSGHLVDRPYYISRASPMGTVRLRDPDVRQTKIRGETSHPISQCENGTLNLYHSDPYQFMVPVMYSNTLKGCHYTLNQLNQFAHQLPKYRGTLGVPLFRWTWSAVLIGLRSHPKTTDITDHVEYPPVTPGNKAKKTRR